MKLAAAYMRKSVSPGGRQMLSFVAQRRHISEFAEVNGYKIIKWYKETFTGVEVDGRKVFLRMVQDACSGEYGIRHIICYDISRFGRLANDEAAFWRYQLRRNGVEVVYSSEDLPGGDGGNPHAVVRQMPDRTKEVYDPAGVLVRTLPKGTRLRKASMDYSVLVLSAAERVGTVRKIFEWYVEEDMGRFRVAQRLNNELARGKGPSAPLGGPWANSILQQILLNEAYVGNTVYGRRSRAKFFRIKRGRAVRQEERAGATARPNSPREWTVIEGTHEPIVALDLFRRAQEKRTARRRSGPLRGCTRSVTFIFEGRLRCGECGSSYGGRRSYWKGKLSLGYSCGRYSSCGKSVCICGTLPEWLLESAVLEALAEEFNDVSALNAKAADAAIQVRTPHGGTRSTEERIRQLDKELGRLFRGITPLNKDRFSKRMVAAHAERRKLTFEPRSLPSTGRTHLADTIRKLAELARGLPRSWDAASATEKREMLSLTIDHIVLYPKSKRARIWWSEGSLRAREAEASAARRLPPGRRTRGACTEVDIPKWGALRGTSRST